MKRIAPCIVLLAFMAAACSSCAGKTYMPNEGPVRVKCQAVTTFAIVNQPWSWACRLDGDLQQYVGSTIGMEIITKGYEDQPDRSVIGEGLKRYYAYNSDFNEEYYRLLTGNVILGPDDRNAEIIREDDPSYPAVGVEGLESELDGSFWLKVRFFELEYVSSTEVNAKLIAQGTVRGKLNCHSCTI